MFSCCTSAPAVATDIIEVPVEAPATTKAGEDQETPAVATEMEAAEAEAAAAEAVAAEAAEAAEVAKAAEAAEVAEAPPAAEMQAVPAPEVVAPEALAPVAPTAETHAPVALKPGLEYTVGLERAQGKKKGLFICGGAEQKVGLSLDKGDDKTLIVKKIQPGLVKTWNRNCKADAVVHVGDRIVQINGVRDSTDALLDEIKKKTGPFNLVLVRPDGYEI